MVAPAMGSPVAESVTVPVSTRSWAARDVPANARHAAASHTNRGFIGPSVVALSNYVVKDDGVCEGRDKAPSRDCQDSGRRGGRAASWNLGIWKSSADRALRAVESDTAGHPGRYRVRVSPGPSPRWVRR